MHDLRRARRDNGAEFAPRVRERFGLDARTLTGDEEARLTFLGATAGARPTTTPLLVIDIGGGSTELVVGARGEVDFHVSTQVGVVRHTERHLHTDPPPPDELDALRGRRARRARGGRARARARGARAAIAVAGTATQCAAIDLELEPYDPARVEGHVLSRDRARARCSRGSRRSRSPSAATSPGLRPGPRARRSSPAS